MPAFETQLDILYFALSIFAGAMTILLSLLIIRVFNILGDVQKITHLVKETAELVNEFAWKPIEIFLHLKEYVKNHWK